jgi:hypothetical protein
MKIFPKMVESGENIFMKIQEKQALIKAECTFINDSVKCLTLKGEKFERRDQSNQMVSTLCHLTDNDF